MTATAYSDLRPLTDTRLPPDALLRVLRSQLPSFLSAQSLDWCERVAAGVPAAARSHYLECRPGTSERVDFMSSFETKTLGAEYRASLGMQAHSAVWQTNLRLLDAWADGQSALTHASRLWFEYDASSAEVRSHADPSASIGLERDYYMRHVRSLAGVSQRSVELLRTSLQILLPAARAHATWALVQRCLAALGTQGSVGYLSVMSSRSPVVSKLFVILPRDGVDAFLAQIEWPGDRKAAQALLCEFYAPSVRTAYLDLTLSDRVESRLGLATSQFQRRELDPVDGQAWLRLPASLGAESTELLRWTGVHIASVGTTRVALRRWLDAKAVLDDDGVQFKAYLGFMPRF